MSLLQLLLLVVAACVGTANACCQICVSQFYRDLDLLELESNVEKTAIRRFHKWREAQLRQRHPLAGLFIEEAAVAAAAAARRWDFTNLLKRPGTDR